MILSSSSSRPSLPLDRVVNESRPVSPSVSLLAGREFARMIT